MDIKTLKVVEHQGCNIYIRNFNKTFEYLVVIDGQLFTSHMVITPSFKRMFSKEKYTEQELTSITKQLVVMAEATIEHVQSQKK